MSSESPWAVQSIIERIESERQRGGRVARRRPTPHRRRTPSVWRYALGLLELALFGDGAAGSGARHAVR
ncbi:hypothetical protein [Nocardia sp. NPDC004722]